MKTYDSKASIFLLLLAPTSHVSLHSKEFERLSQSAVTMRLSLLSTALLSSTAIQATKLLGTAAGHDLISRRADAAPPAPHLATNGRPPTRISMDSRPTLQCMIYGLYPLQVAQAAATAGMDVPPVLIHTTISWVAVIPVACKSFSIVHCVHISNIARVYGRLYCFIRLRHMSE